jgi:glycosyltransferase involved in cell wall biosynthesis
LSVAPPPVTVGFVLSHINKSLQWLWFAEELQARGVPHVFVLVETGRPLLADDLARLGTPVYVLPHVGFRSHLVNVLRCARLLRRHHVAVLHTSLPYGNLVGLLAGALLGIRPRLTTCENPSWAKDQGSRKQELIDRLAFRLAHRVIACTALAREYLGRTFGVPDSKMTVIPHSLKVSDYEGVGRKRVERVRAQSGIREGDFVIGMVARLESWKGHVYAVRAMKRVAARHPNARLFIFGSDGPARGELERCIQENDLSGVVAYKGFVDDPIALFRTFDIHVHVPINAIVENTGINIIEGMISGCAQVLTRSGFSYDLARHLENAWVVGYEDADAIAEALLALIADPELRRRLGAEAACDARRQFDYRVKVDRHLAEYGMESGPTKAAEAPQA